MGLENLVDRGVKKAKKAFSLVELLTVTGVVAILAGLLLPVLVKSKEAASESKMNSNARQIMLACEQYGIDYGSKQVLPTVQTVSKIKWANSQETALPVLLRDGYLGAKKTESVQQIIDSVGNLANFDTDGKVNILSQGSLVARDEIIQDTFYDSSNPGKLLGAGTVPYGPFGPNRASIWLHNDSTKNITQRIQQEVLMSIGWRGKDKKWDTDPYNNSTGYNGLNDSWWIFTESGGWKQLKNEVKKN